eukprot:8463690-Alexandrium_andersonii.AAC.1
MPVGEARGPHRFQRQVAERPRGCNALARTALNSSCRGCRCVARVTVDGPSTDSLCFLRQDAVSRPVRQGCACRFRAC